MASVGKNLRKPEGGESGVTSPPIDEANGTNIGEALRSAYEETVSENIPDEMLDLLGKLN